MNLKHFKREEFTCEVSGTNNMEKEFLEKLDELRAYCDFPFIITSGYRHPTMEDQHRRCKRPTKSSYHAYECHDARPHLTFETKYH